MKASAATMVAMMWSDGEISPVRPAVNRQQALKAAPQLARTCQRDEQVQESHRACNTASARKLQGRPAILTLAAEDRRHNRQEEVGGRLDSPVRRIVLELDAAEALQNEVVGSRARTGTGQQGAVKSRTICLTRGAR
jgi:hypothetical protein